MIHGALLSRQILLICLLLFSGFGCLAQSVRISGKLLSTEGSSPIAFANIGIVDTPVGTISNEDGTFEIEIPEQYKLRELLFAALGYERKSYLVNAIDATVPLVVKLSEHSTVLHNVVVKSGKTTPVRKGEFGNRHFNEGSIYADSSASGSAMALLIENKYPAHLPEVIPPYHVLDARVRIAHNTFEKFKIRLRFMSVDPVTNLPDRDLVDESIVIASGMRKGWLKFDLSGYNIRISDPSFFIVFEWLLEDEDRLLLLEQYKEFRRQFPRKVTVDTLVVDGQKITFNSWNGFRAGTSFGSSSNRFALDNFKCYYRSNSYGRWKRSSFVLAARLTVANY